MTDIRVGGAGDRLAWARGLEPTAIWREFAALSAIPRKSKQEHAARRHVMDRLTDLGFTAQVDAVGNVIADVPASHAARSADPVMLQAHLDMVCEADTEVGTDPAVDGVYPAVVGDWVVAPGTTLGADDGIGVATALAIAAEASSEAGGGREWPRPPLQLLFTVDEEEDFSGAAGARVGAAVVASGRPRRAPCPIRELCPAGPGAVSLSPPSTLPGNRISRARSSMWSAQPSSKCMDVTPTSRRCTPGWRQARSRRTCPASWPSRSVQPSRVRTARRTARDRVSRAVPRPGRGILARLAAAPPGTDPRESRED
jgi:hypothetical protein